MSVQCPFCLKDDLTEGASKCFHCGAWLVEGTQSDRIATLEQDLRQQFSSDVQAHRDYLSGLLSQLRWVATAIVAMALGAAVFFGFRTDQSIIDTAVKIADVAETEIRDATEDIPEQVSQKVAAAVEEKMNSTETVELIEKTIIENVQASVKAEVDAQAAAIDASVQEQLQASRAILQSVNGEIEALRAAATKASSDLGVIQSSFDNAQRQTVEESQSVLPILQLQIEGKGGLDQLEFIVSNEAQENALSFQIGGSYVGSFIWKYLDELSRLPNFRYVVLLGGEGGIFGFYDAAVLSAVFNPANTLVLSERYRNQISDLPLPDEVPGWNRFAELVQSANTRELAALPSFVSGDKPIRSDWSSLKALAHMQDLGVSKLPVIDGSDQIIGIIDRSRLTTRVVLEIAGDRN